MKLALLQETRKIIIKLILFLFHQHYFEFYVVFRVFVVWVYTMCNIKSFSLSLSLSGASFRPEYVVAGR